MWALLVDCETYSGKSKCIFVRTLYGSSRHDETPPCMYLMSFWRGKKGKKKEEKNSHTLDTCITIIVVYGNNFQRWKSTKSDAVSDYISLVYNNLQSTVIMHCESSGDRKLIQQHPWVSREVTLKLC